MKKNIQKRLALLVFLLGVAGNLLAQGSTNMALVAETDFSCSIQDSTKSFISLTEVDGFGNSLIKPRLSTSLPLATTTRSTEKKSDFLSKAQYAITSNPKNLDELRMIDEEGGGFVTSTTKSGQVLLNMTVNGLKDKSDYRVEIEYSVPLTDNEIQSSYYNVALRAIANPDYNNTTNGELGQDLDSHTIKAGHTSTLVVTQNSTGSYPISGGTLYLYISAAKGALGQAIMIKSIKVYGTVETEIQGKESICTESTQPIIYANGKNVKSIHLSSGESVTLTSNNVMSENESGNPYTNYTMSWHKGNAESKPISNAVGSVAKPLEVKWEDADKKGTSFILKVQDNILNANDEKIDDCNSYDTIIVYADAALISDDIYCLDDEGNQTPMKLIWQEDFGTFTSATDYWTWDYSDLSNPTKKEHVDGRDWTTSTDLTPSANVTYDLSPSTEGKYCVAANVTCSDDSVKGGTQWGWEAYFGNGRNPKYNDWTFVPDHTYGTSAYGGMLFINCDNVQDMPIYTQKISNLTQGNYTALCHVNTFNNERNPVDIYLQVKDLTTGDIFKSRRATKASTGSTNWIAVRLNFELQGSEIELSVVSYAGSGTSESLEYNKYGNDLVLDDIQLYTCKVSEHVGVETQPAENIDEIVNVYTITGALVKSNVRRSKALDGLKKGTYYIVGHEKVLVDL